MTEPPSPTSSSIYSCFSDSETSNDSGVDSMSAGSFPPDYMDIDEFLIATGVKQFSTDQNVVQELVSQYQDNKLSQQIQENSTKNEDLISKTERKKQDSQNNNREDLQQKEEKPKSLSKRRKSESKYTYKYNPLPVGKKARRKFVSDDNKDEKYWKRRVRNNEAARRSRDMRRQREIEISTKWKELEKENERLKKELQKLRDRADELEKQLLQSKQSL